MNRKMLILDDEELILVMLKKHFSAYFFDVDTARRTGEAKRLLEETAYSVVILDLGLNFLDRTEGLEMVEHLRRHCPHTAIVVYTGNPNPDVKELAERMGVDAFVLKPSRLSELGRIVMRLCGVRPPVLSRGHL